MRLRVEGLTKTFGDNTAVNAISLDLASGTLTGLLGPSGCGKSTLLYMISGLEKPTSGRIYFDDEDVTDMPAQLRGIGLVFQNYALYPHLTVEQNIRFPLDNDRRLSRQEKRERVQHIASLVQIDDLLDRKPSQLSGGQQQRVAIARVLVKRPRVLLLDEPLSNLDAQLRIEMRREIRKIQQNTGVTTLFVTHDQEEAMSITDNIVLLRKGVVQQFGTADQLYYHPENRFVASFLGNPPINFLPGQPAGGVLTINGYEVAHGLPDRPLEVAIRPEAFQLGDKGMAVVVTDVEMRGKDRLAYFNLSGVPCCATFDSTCALSPGDTIHLQLHREMLHFFDAANGQRL